MKARIYISIFIIFLITSVVPFLTVHAAQSLTPITGKFTSDGLRLTIKSTGQYLITITSLEIVSCDGTQQSFYPMPHVSFREEGWTYFSSEPMERVNIIIIDPFYEFQSGVNPLTVISVSHNCKNAEIPPNLTCKNVIVTPILHRKDSETISFKTNHPIVTAGLRFPGVDGLVWVETIIWNHGLRSEPNLSFDDKARVWSGKFPSMNIPVGDYKDVWLLVFDEFGQQAACKIGKLSILP